MRVNSESALFHIAIPEFFLNVDHLCKYYTVQKFQMTSHDKMRHTRYEDIVS